jgi:hypothetical protein
MSLTLSEKELYELTKKERPSAQAKVLAFMGIPYKPRPDGSLAVYRIHLFHETQEKEHQAPALRLS